MKSSFRFGKILGIEIGAHFSWLIIAAIITLSLASYFSQMQPGWIPSHYWSAAIITSLFFFSSIVAHELGHTLVARHYGITVKEITLFLFGGISKMEQETQTPKQDILIALAGPIVSFVLGLIFMAISIMSGINSFHGVIAGLLATINIGLAFFNLIPGFPLDGGRVMRGVIWWMVGDLQRATKIAAQIGQTIAMMLIILGILIFFYQNSGSGIWLVLISWFLFDAARKSELLGEATDMLQNVTAAHLMSREIPTVAADTNLMQFVDNYLKRNGQRFAMVTDNNVPVGLITISDLHKVDQTCWAQTEVAELMRPMNRLFFVMASDPAKKALEIMARENIKQLPVIESDQVRGVISQAHFINLFSTCQELESIPKLPQPQFN